MVHRRSSKSIVARQHDDPVRKQILRVAQNRRHRRPTTKDRSRCGSARRHLWAQLSTANLAEVHLPDYIRRSRLRPVEDRRMKLASNEKECRALVLSRRHPSASTSSSSNSNEAARLPQPITARGTASRKVETRDNQKKRHRQGTNSFWRNNTSGSGTRKLRSRFCWRRIAGFSRERNYRNTRAMRASDWPKNKASVNSRPRYGVRRCSAAFNKDCQQPKRVAF